MRATVKIPATRCSAWPGNLVHSELCTTSGVSKHFLYSAREETLSLCTNAQVDNTQTNGAAAFKEIFIYKNRQQVLFAKSLGYNNSEKSLEVKTLF